MMMMMMMMMIMKLQDYPHPLQP